MDSLKDQKDVEFDFDKLENEIDFWSMTDVITMMAV
jgi:hypothetical protein